MILFRFQIVMLSDRCDVHIWRGPFNGMISGRLHCIIIWNPIFFSINRFLFRNITLNPIFALLKRNERHSPLPYQYLREIWHISIIRRCCANENTTMNVFLISGKTMISILIKIQMSNMSYLSSDRKYQYWANYIIQF